MSVSPYQALIAAPVPRPKQLVASYVDHNTASHKKMVWILVAIAVGTWLLAGTMDAKGGHSSSILMSYVKSSGVMVAAFFMLIGPALLFWSVNKSSLARHLRDGQLLRARVRTRNVFHVRGTPLLKIVAEFEAAAGSIRQAQFEASLEEAPLEGSEIWVLRRTGTTVAVVWPDEGAALARLL